MQIIRSNCKTFIRIFGTILDGVFLGEEREDLGVHVEDVGPILLCRSLPGSLDSLLESNQRAEEVPPTRIPRLDLFTSSEPATAPDPLVRTPWPPSTKGRLTSRSSAASVTPWGLSGSTVVEVEFLAQRSVKTQIKRFMATLQPLIGRG